jgi:hypothetical protein
MCLPVRQLSEFFHIPDEDAVAIKIMAKRIILINK